MGKLTIPSCIGCVYIPGVCVAIVVGVLNCLHCNEVFELIFTLLYFDKLRIRMRLDRGD